MEHRQAQLDRAKEGVWWAGFLARRQSLPFASIAATPMALLERDIAHAIVDAARTEAKRRFDARESPPEGGSTYDRAVARIQTAMEDERRREAAARQAEAMAQQRALAQR